MSRQVVPSSEVHRMLPKAPSAPMATRPSPPGTTLVIALAFADSGTVAVPHSTLGGVAVGGVGAGDSAGSLGAGVADGSALGLCGTDGADGDAVCVLHAAMTVMAASMVASAMRRQRSSMFIGACFVLRVSVASVAPPPAAAACDVCRPVPRRLHGATLIRIEPGLNRSGLHSMQRES